MNPITVTVPLASLSLPDTDGGEAGSQDAAPVAPSVGDSVNLDITAKVKSISGDNAILEVTHINGEEPEQNEGDEQPEGEDVMMRGMAAKADQGGGMGDY